MLLILLCIHRYICRNAIVDGHLLVVFQISPDFNVEPFLRSILVRCSGDHLGVTLAFGLPLETGHIEAAAQIGGLIDRFRQRVDAELPGMYAWFADSSLHVTLRAVI